MATTDTAVRVPSSPRPRRGTAIFTVRRIPPAVTVVSVAGDVDAANAREFSNYAQLHLAHTEQLVLDLTDVEFFATEAFSMLHTVSVAAAGRDARWALIPSAAVRRMLQICDPDGVLPAGDQLADALARVHGQPPRLLQLVAKLR